MDQTLLHLVDRGGQTLPRSVRQAVESAHRWVNRQYPHLDPAVVAGWAEDVARLMAARLEEIHSPYRYAYAALHGRVREWLRSRPAKEFTVGLGSELEQWAGVDRIAPRKIYQTVLFEQLRTQLSERDTQILVLLQQDITSPRQIAAALGLNYMAAAKAIQRTKERIAAILTDSPAGRTDRSRQFGGESRR